MQQVFVGSESRGRGAKLSFRSGKDFENVYEDGYLRLAMREGWLDKPGDYSELRQS